MFRPTLRAVFSGLLALCLSSILGACSSGGGDDGNNPPAAVTITGTAAMGAPIGNSTITIISASGISRTATTGLDGAFTADVTGLTGPYLLQTGTGTDTLSSWSPGSGVANITPLTTLALELAIVSDVLDQSIDWLTVHTEVTQADINAMLGVINANLQSQFNAAGLTPQTYNFLSTPFVANGTGIDQVLDGVHITFDFEQGTFQLRDPSDQPIPFDPDIDTTGYVGGTSGGGGGGGGGTGPVNLTVTNANMANGNGTIAGSLVTSSEISDQGVQTVLVGVGGSVGGSWGISMNTYYVKETNAVTKVTFGWSSFTAGGGAYFAACGLGGTASCEGVTVNVSTTPATITLTNVSVATPTGLGLAAASATLNGTIKFSPPAQSP